VGCVVDAKLQEHTVKRKEGILRVCNLFKSPQKCAGKRGPLEVKAAHQRDDLEIVCDYPYHNSLRLVPLWILK
jgi:hypothetical protein